MTIAPESSSYFIEFDSQQIPTTNEDYLLNQADWSPELANHLANALGIELSEQHWQVIDLVRWYYQEFNTTPGIRLIVRNLAKKYGSEIGNSRQLQKMFAIDESSPALIIAKIAGLPKPAKCL